MAALAAACTSASAAGDYSFVAYLNGAGGHSAAGGSLSIQGVDPTKSIRIEVDPIAGPANAPVEIANPGEVVDMPFIPGLAGGDTVNVWQPADKSSAPEAHVIEAPTIRYEDKALRGTVPAGYTGEIQTDAACERVVQRFTEVTSDFAFMHAPGDGMFMTISASNADGDVSVVTNSTDGETPCFRVNASSRVSGYTVAATHLNGTPSETSELEVIRGGVSVGEALGDGTGVVLISNLVPRPGDVINLYRDGNLSKSVTLPTVTSTFNTTTDQVAVTAPEASAVRVTPQHTIQFRLQRFLAAGSTNFDFSQPADSFPAYDIQPSDAVYAEFVNSDHTLEYYVDAVDVTPVVTPDEPKVVEKGAPVDKSRPKVSFKLARKLKLQSKGLSIKLTSNERITYRAELSLAPTSGSKKVVRVATSSGRIPTGSRKITIKLTKAGKRYLRTLRTNRKALRLATLKITATDVAGNVTTVTRSTKLRP